MQGGQGATAVCDFLNSLGILRTELKIVFDHPVELPVWAEESLRSVFGYALKKVACVTELPTCENCPFLSRCAFPTLFPSATAGNLPDSVPYILNVSVANPTAKVGAATVYLTIMEKSRIHFASVLTAFEMAGKLGLGKSRVEFALDCVRVERELGSGRFEEWSGQSLLHTPKVQIPSSPEGNICVALHTPIRIKRAGRLVGPEAFGFPDLVQGIRQRFRNLSVDNFPVPALPNPRDFKVMNGVTVQLTWREYSRYSSRQNRVLKAGGVIGEITLEEPGRTATWESFWPVLWAAQWVHVGRSTSMGFGRIRVTKR